MSKSKYSCIGALVGLLIGFIISMILSGYFLTSYIFKLNLLLTGSIVGGFIVGAAIRIFFTGAIVAQMLAFALSGRKWGGITRIIFTLVFFFGFMLISFQFGDAGLIIIEGFIVGIFAGAVILGSILTGSLMLFLMFIPQLASTSLEVLVLGAILGMVGGVIGETICYAVNRKIVIALGGSDFAFKTIGSSYSDAIVSMSIGRPFSGLISGAFVGLLYSTSDIFFNERLVVVVSSIVEKSPNSAISSVLKLGENPIFIIPIFLFVGYLSGACAYDKAQCLKKWIKLIDRIKLEAANPTSKNLPPVSFEEEEES